ncbi:ABC transporter substrate-binding protein [Bifidobacterium psychraerophilum]|jgi:branched-chain amino acid transport system substrate-binding protein|uniref:ABC transporter substrate-binding protein n=1 Tax=Bifidobacterium psychraerophilum TaxID=218140 RepID=UPI0023F21AAA|nr:ABC transporter substrate-binding protein [Bifidobacterium psychraerophilum]MCI1804844.1 ABC transporter substrate-binding protein [Bifidobacterium psychraerophilum]MCI2176820.1 ABC transporter substrate-binding protein [Bifidobacterium psychraerophilum]MCI2182594.1 ABC transporter substrate-binding protein [Bifidobacterium psychraerophilum]
MTNLKRHLRSGAALIVAAGTVFGASACGLGGDSSASSSASGSDTVNIGVIYPKTGQYAEYGKLFEEGFNLAIEKVNADGGVQGKKLGLKYFDTQSDAKQDAAVAPKLVADKSIIAVVGDYASPASSAASPIFQQAGLVHYGFNNSAPTFTDTGDHVWTPQIGQDKYQQANADIVAKKAKKISVVYIENDWGKQAYEYFKEAAAKNGTEIVYQSSYLADSTDLSPILIPARDAKPDAVVDIGYGPDGALVLNTLRDKLGYTGQYFGGQETKEFLDLAGDNANGTIITGSFSATGTKDAKAKEFVKDFKAKYGNNPGNFEVTAYQAIIDLAHAANSTDATREGIQKALKTVTDFPLYQGNGGTFKFNQSTRRADNIDPILLIVKDGKFEQYEG